MYVYIYVHMFVVYVHNVGAATRRGSEVPPKTQDSGLLIFSFAQTEPGTLTPENVEPDVARKL